MEKMTSSACNSEDPEALSSGSQGALASLFNPGSSLRRFLCYVQPYFGLLLIATVFGVLKFSIPIAVPVVVGYVIDDVATSGLLSMGEKQAYINRICGILLIGFLASGVGIYFRHFLAAKVQYQTILDLRVALFHHMQRLSLSFYARERTGSLLSRLFSDIELAKTFIGSACTNIWMDGITAIIIAGILVWQDWKLSLLVFVLLPFKFLCFRSFNPKIKKSSREMQKRLADMSGDVHEKLSGISVVQAFTSEKKEDRRFLSGNLDLFAEQISNARYASTFHSLFHTLIVTAPLLVLWIGSIRVLHSMALEATTGISAREIGLSAGELMTFLMLVPQFQTPLTRFADLNVIVQNSLAAMDRIFEIFDVMPEIKDREGARELADVEGRIEFRSVSFGYDATEPVLRDINLTVEPQSTVALVGPSGAGKSTVVSLVSRFFDIDEGQILLDGVDLRDIKVKSLRGQIGLIPQTVILFSGTIEENIRYGRPSATREEVEQAARAANAHDFIMGLPSGYQTNVGESGLRLSGGQKQRIAIARAFLKDPKILVLDEATSALDSESENQISEALSNLLRGRTTIIIAHRLSTIMAADKIVAIEDGKIREEGTHLELLARRGLYFHLCEEQYKVLFALEDEGRQMRLAR